MVKRIHPFRYGHVSFPSYLFIFRLHHSDNCACGEKGDTLHYATSCHLTSYFHFTKGSAENTLLWWQNLLLNELPRIKIAKLISFFTDNKDLMKQQTDATSSSDSDPDFSSSSRSHSDQPRPSRADMGKLRPAGRLYPAHG
ncbi:hypothetical protein AVEN_160677-1 [Araneus ventricosus]|uniref:Uncharacterized protein n=1 Tax=Araneus ventricosus TaxID=182803 RepID=A0A4Y2JSN4_ARAVE|nr:hypothetical protein AVEN_160677-1 [Araneus ventricosus]